MASDSYIDSAVVPELETPSSSPKNTITEEMRAIRDAHELLERIKNKDADKLIQLLSKSVSSHLDIEGANKIIEAFNINFDIESLLVKTHNNGPAMHPESGQYEFILMDNSFKLNQEENSLVIQYQDGGVVYHNPYIRYFPFAEKMVVRYLDLIDQGNTTELASFLNPDDVDVPDWVAVAVVRNYKAFFNAEKK